MDNEILLNIKGIFDGHSKIKYRGITIAKCPFDYVIYQMIINEIKPDLIIEIGTSEGGSSVYMADILDIIGKKGEIHTIDIKDKIDSNIFNNHKRIKYFNKGFQEYDINNAKGFNKILVIDDGTHGSGDVFDSLVKFSDLVSYGSYFIVEDGAINSFIKNGIFDDDYWGGGPLKAIENFLKLKNDFIIDRTWCDFFGKNVTFNVNGYLKKISKYTIDYSISNSKTFNYSTNSEYPIDIKIEVYENDKLYYNSEVKIFKNINYFTTLIDGKTTKKVKILDKNSGNEIIFFLN